MTVAAVIPHWNRRDLLAALLANLKLQTRPFDQVIVADNGSTDDSADMAEKAGARVLRLGTNRGFSAAVNRGTAAASADLIAILNNDITLDPDWLQTLLAASAHQDTWFATGKIMSTATPSVNQVTIDATFDEISRGACSWRCGAGMLDAPTWNQPRPIRIAPMTAALFRRQLFDDIGPLDEQFESYLEDADFGLRCCIADRRGVYVPDARAFHVGSATWGKWNKDTVRLISRNQVLLARKHFGGQSLWPLVAGQLLWGLVAFRHLRGFSYVRGKLEGLSAPVSRMGQPPSLVRAVLEESERIIFDLQQQAGFDLYWRAYFWLVPR